jgi:hypothetical protein
MTKAWILAFTLAASLAAASVADAAGGCGVYRHRGPYGGCQPNGGVVVAGPVVVGPVVVRPVVGRACPLGYHLGPYGHCRLN